MEELEKKLKRALELLSDANDFIGSARFELGEDFDEDNLEGTITKFLSDM